MRIYSYTPSVNVYAAVKTQGGEEYYDLSEDVVSCSVNRICENASSFDITLLNRGLKYNGLFSPFDRIVIVANKNSQSYRLLTGYVTEFTRFTLYEEDFKLKGKDTLYRLSQLFFDPNLHETGLMLSETVPNRIDGEGWRRLYAVLTKIAGWPDDMISIEQNIPDDVVSWARDMYLAQKTDYEQSEQIIQDMFSAIIATSASAIISTGNTAGGVGRATNANVENAVQWALAIANDDTHGYSLIEPFGNPDYCCASLVTAAFAQAGFGVNAGIASVTLMIPDFLEHGFEFIQDPSLKGIQRGDIIIIYDNCHTELYIGGEEAVGAHDNHDGRQGDSGGKEISVARYNRDSRGYRGYLHYKGA